MIKAAMHGMININWAIRNFILTLLGAIKSRRVIWVCRVARMSEWERSTQLCIKISSALWNLLEGKRVLWINLTEYLGSLWTGFTCCCMLCFGWFPGVWNLYADVSEHSVPSS